MRRGKEMKLLPSDSGAPLELHLGCTLNLPSVGYCCWTRESWENLQPLVFSSDSSKDPTLSFQFLERPKVNEFYFT